MSRAADPTAGWFLAVKVAVGAHLHPELGHIARGIGQQGIDRRQGGRRALVGGLVERMQDDADQQRLAGFLPVRFQAAAVRVDDQRGEVLHVADLVLGTDPDFVERVPADAAAGRSGLEAQHPVFLRAAGASRRSRPRARLSGR
jgi:hypothetical protein